jgi:hypothetical protein
MSNPVIDNIRRSLGRNAQISPPQGAPLSLRPAIYESRRAGTTDSEIQLFLDELKNLSGVGQRFAPSGIAEALKTIVAEKDIHKATVWDTPHLQ